MHEKGTMMGNPIIFINNPQIKIYSPVWMSRGLPLDTPLNRASTLSAVKSSDLVPAQSLPASCDVCVYVCMYVCPYISIYNMCTYYSIHIWDIVIMYMQLHKET